MLSQLVKPNVFSRSAMPLQMQKTYTYSCGEWHDSKMVVVYLLLKRSSLQVRNFGLFRDMIKTQKIMSPAFSAGECSLRLSVYQSAVNSTDYLSMCLESKDTDKTGNAERSCWCLFRMSVMTQAQKGRHMHRDSYGRFAADSKTGDNTRYMLYTR